MPEVMPSSTVAGSSASGAVSLVDWWLPLPTVAKFETSRPPERTNPPPKFWLLDTDVVTCCLSVSPWLVPPSLPDWPVVLASNWIVKLLVPVLYTTRTDTDLPAFRAPRLHRSPPVAVHE